MAQTVSFTIDPKSGDMETHIDGVKGKACDDIAKIIKELVGEPGEERMTGEYYEKSQSNVLRINT